MSYNVELPSEKSLTLLAPQKTKDSLLMPMKELKNAIAAVSLAVKSLIIGGIFWTIFFAIYLLWLSDTFADDSYMFMANLAITLLPILYGFFGTMILLPIKARLEKQQE